MKKTNNSNENFPRKGLKDIWNLFMIQDAIPSPTTDMPFVQTGNQKIPTALISFEKAKCIYKKEIKKNKDFKVDAFIHFYIDDYKFDGKRNSIWTYPEKAYQIIKHFEGIITPDFSTYADFPDPIKRYNTYRMRAFGCWIASLGIPVIHNVRWGAYETYQYCFDSVPKHSIIAIGSVASGIKMKSSRPLFEEGFKFMCEYLEPEAVIIYGSDKITCIDEAKKCGIKVITFESETNTAFKRSKKHV